MPVVIVILLFVASILISVIGKKAVAKAVTLIALGAAFVASVVMAISALNGQVFSLIIGADPWNLSMLVGPLESFMALIFTGIGFFIMWASTSMIEHDVEESKIPLYYTLVCALIGTLCCVVFFNNMINIFIFIELSSFAAAGIVIIKNLPENLRAGLKYLTLSILGSGLVLMGIVILYSLTGALTMDAIHAALVNGFAGNENSVLYALLFITAGVMFKSALFPCHIWLPDAHGTAPSPSSAVLSSLVLKAYIIFYIKVLFKVVGMDMLASHNIGLLMSAVLILGVVAMLAGSIMAILQTDIKRMIAYSSVAQIGYIFMGIGLGNELGLYAAIFHILAHAVTKSGLFLNAGSIIEQTHNRRLDKMAGLGVIMPVTMALFTIGALSMVGIPLFIGFNSKWNFAMAIMDSHKVWVMIALAISSLLNALYYLPVVVRAFFGAEAKALKEKGERVERPIKDLLPIIILAGLVIIIAIFSAPFAKLIGAGIASL